MNTRSKHRLVYIYKLCVTILQKGASIARPGAICHSHPARSIEIKPSFFGSTKAGLSSHGIRARYPEGYRPHVTYDLAQTCSQQAS